MLKEGELVLKLTVLQLKVLRMKYLKIYRKRLQRLAQTCSRRVFSHKTEDLNRALKAQNEKLKTDVFELTKEMFDWSQRIKGKIIFCPKCNGLIYIFKDKVLHDGTCDLEDGCIISVEIVEESLQKRLKEVLKC
mgnify:CR=1 FL=1